MEKRYTIQIQVYNLKRPYVVELHFPGESRNGSNMKLMFITSTYHLFCALSSAFFLVSFFLEFLHLLHFHYDSSASLHLLYFISTSFCSPFFLILILLLFSFYTSLSFCSYFFFTLSSLLFLILLVF